MGRPRDCVRRAGVLNKGQFRHLLRNLARQREFFKLDENEDLSRDAFIRFMAEEEDMHILSNGPPPNKPAEEILQEANGYWR